MSASPCFGIFWGLAEEIVYSSNGSYYCDIISQLLWDMKPVYYYGMDINLSPAEEWRQRGFFSFLSLKHGIPRPCGKMEDLDWLSYENSALTHYSSHENYIDEILLIDAFAGYVFPIKSMFKIKAGIAFSYTHISFTGIDGYGIYAQSSSGGHYNPINDSPDLKKFSGKVISYSQDWLVLSGGLSFGVKFLNYLYFETGINISPLIACIDVDFHVLKKKQFTDALFGGFYYEPQAGLFFTINKWINVSMNMAYRSIKGTRGKAYMRTIGIDDYFNETGEAGAGMYLLNASILANIKF